MVFIENIFVCLVGTLVIAALIAKNNSRLIFLFIAIGMEICLTSAYINTFFARHYGADMVSAATEIAPVCEEILKLLPLLFYIYIFEPKPEEALNAIIAIAVGFATFENVSYLTQNYSVTLSHMLVRGFGVSAMHIVTGAIVGYGLFHIWSQSWLKLAGTLGLLCTAITFHAIFNMLVSEAGLVRYIGYLLPVFAIILGKLLDTQVNRITAPK